MTCMGKDFLSLKDFSSQAIRNMIQRALAAKRGDPLPSLKGKALVALFFNPSLRTRISFQRAMQRLGGEVIIINVGQDLWAIEFEDGTVMDGGTSEHIKEAARVLTRYADCLAVRAFPKFQSWDDDRQDRVVQGFARESDVPVVNMESARFHPCQGLADALTIQERIPEPSGKPIMITWAWHPKPLPLSVTHSALLASAHLGMRIRLACPPGYDPDPEVLEFTRSCATSNGGGLDIFHDQQAAAEGAQVVLAKSWTSPANWSDGDAELQNRKAHAGWQVNPSLMARTDGAFFMHCLPVRRNVVVTDAVLDGDGCAVYDEAENRMWAQMAVLSGAMGIED